MMFYGYRITMGFGLLQSADPPMLGRTRGKNRLRVAHSTAIGCPRRLKGRHTDIVEYWLAAYAIAVQDGIVCPLEVTAKKIPYARAYATGETALLENGETWDERMVRVVQACRDKARSANDIGRLCNLHAAQSLYCLKRAQERGLVRLAEYITRTGFGGVMDRQGWIAQAGSASNGRAQ